MYSVFIIQIFLHNLLYDDSSNRNSDCCSDYDYDNDDVLVTMIIMDADDNDGIDGYDIFDDIEDNDTTDDYDNKGDYDNADNCDDDFIGKFFLMIKECRQVDR